MLVSQLIDRDGSVTVVAREGNEAYNVTGTKTLWELALDAANSGKSLVDTIRDAGLGDPVDLNGAYARGQVFLPVHHPDPCHMHLTGTGLTHLGSAATRDAMHAKAAQVSDVEQTDSMKMFRMGLEGGKPPAGEIGVQPEWFYKGNGTLAVAPGAALHSPSFAKDAGEEPEVAGIYIIADDGTPCRIGFALANEFSDHVTERGNYLWLAHSKLRNCSFGPEILMGALPADVRAISRILRDGKTVWEKSFFSGEANMSHTIANLEHHHFKYDLFRQPGDLHVHMFGTATLSFADDFRTQSGDVFELDCETFGLPLRNPLAVDESTERLTLVRPL